MAAAAAGPETEIVAAGAPKAPPTADKDGGSGSAPRGRKRTRLWQRFVLSFLTRAGRALQTMPRERALRWGERIGLLAYRVAERQKRYGRRNLRLAQFPSPTATDAEREELLRRVFVQFAKTLVELFRSPVTTTEEVHSLVRVEGWEHLEGALAKGKGIVFLSAHFGNWEILGRYVVSRGVPLTVIARDPEDPEFAAMLRSLRDAEGFRVLDKGSAARDIFTLLKRGEAVGMLPDQNSGDVMVPFFGVPCGTPTGPAVFALRTGAPIVPCFGVRLPDDTYRVLILPPVPAEPSGDRAADVQRVMGEINRVLEGVVREYPDQWLWVHNRWKAAFEPGNLQRAWPDGAGGAASPAYRAALARWAA